MTIADDNRARELDLIRALKQKLEAYAENPVSFNNDESDALYDLLSGLETRLRSEQVRSDERARP